MQFDNETLYLDDRMFDITRGYGKVIQLKENILELDFQGRKVAYTLEGVQRGKTYRTLFWDVPYILAPSKNEAHWTVKREKFNAIVAILKN